MWKAFLQILDNDLGFQVIIRMMEMKLDGHICKKVLINQEIMIFQKQIVGLLFVDLILIGNWLEYSISKDAFFVFIVILWNLRPKLMMHL